MNGSEILLIAIAAGLGSVITAIAGLGGGILLLSVLLQFMDPTVAIPVHAVIQLASNSSRSVLLRRHIDLSVVWRFCLLLIPAGLVGLLVADSMPVSLGRVSIASFALLVVWRPSALGRLSSLLGGGSRSFVSLGAIAGFANIPFGVTGPAVAPVFRSFLPTKEAMIATFGATQTVGHLVKVGIFAGDGFDFPAYIGVMVAGVVAVTIGTWLGTRVLTSLNEETFAAVFRWTLTIVAVRVVLTAW